MASVAKKDNCKVTIKINFLYFDLAGIYLSKILSYYKCNPVFHFKTTTGTSVSLWEKAGSPWSTKSKTRKLVK